MNLTGIRAGIFGVLLALAAGGLVTLPLPAFSQTLQSSSLDGEDLLPKAPEVPKPDRKVSFAFRASEMFLAGGTAFDMTTTARSLGHPTTALRSDGSFLTHYYVKEQGWAGIFGRRDTLTAVAANTILNYGVDRYSRKLYARGGWQRKLSYGTVILKGTLNSLAAAGNIRNDSRIDSQVRLATGYQGRIVWAK